MHGAGNRATGGRARAAAAAAVATAAAQAAVATYGLPLDIDPLDALLGELHRTAGHVAWLAQVVGGLDQSRLGQRTLAGTVPSIWVKLYQDERSHLAKVASDCLKAGVEERRVQLAERQGQLVADVIRRIVTSLGLDPASDEVRQVVRRELMAVAS